MTYHYQLAWQLQKAAKEGSKKLAKISDTTNFYGRVLDVPVSKKMMTACLLSAIGRLLKRTRRGKRPVILQNSGKESRWLRS
jgi:hypothetical protein